MRTVRRRPVSTTSRTTPRMTPASAEPESAPDPWYRNRVLLALWALLVAILIVLIIYGLVQLSRGGDMVARPRPRRQRRPRGRRQPPRRRPRPPRRRPHPPPPPPTTPEQGRRRVASAPPAARRAAAPSPPSAAHPVHGHVAAHRDYAAARLLRHSPSSLGGKRARIRR